MPIFKINNKQLQGIKEISIDLEKDLQKIIEENLPLVFGLKFISSEFPLHDFRIDTLGYDEETNSFVIIEYKKDRSFSVIDQGVTYFSLMLKNKDSFIVEYAKKTDKKINQVHIDWKSPRVIFIAQSFTSYQQNSIGFKNLPIELWEVKKYENNILALNQLRTEETNESIDLISKNKDYQKVGREIKKYTINDLIKTNWDEIGILFINLEERILQIDSRIEGKITQSYIGYKIGNNVLCSLHFYKSKISIDISRVEKKDLNDPENKIQDVEWKKFRWGKLCRIEMMSENEIDYVIFIIKQVYNKFYTK